MCFYGTTGRIQPEIPFNATPGGTSRIFIDDGRDLMGGGRVMEEFPACDQYTIQGDLFSRAIREGGHAAGAAGGCGAQHGGDRRGLPLGRVGEVGTVGGEGSPSPGPRSKS